MGLEYFKDKLFDLLNDSEDMGIADIDADEPNNRFMIKMEEGMYLRLYAGNSMEEYRQMAGKNMTITQLCIDIPDER